MTTAESLILSYLLNSLWQVPLVFVAACLIARVLRGTGATVEHRVWVGALLLQATLPGVSLLPWDRLSWQWLHAIIAWRYLRGSGSVHVSVVASAAEGGSASPVLGAVLFLAFAAYSSVSLYFVARYLYRMRMLFVLTHEAVEVSLTGESAEIWSRCVRRFAVPQVSLAASSRIAGPVTLGHVRKVVLLPATMVGSLRDDDLQAVIAHEFAHLRRNDFLKNLLYEFLSLPIAYHPLFRLTRERITETREMVCDQMAADISGRTQYGQSLLRLASLLVHRAPVRIPHAIGIFDANTFERRLMKLTEATTEIRGPRGIITVAACVALTVTTCGTALALRADLAASPATTGQPAAGQAASEGGTAMAPKKVMVSSAVAAGNKLSGNDPVYPPDAKKSKVEGTVVLEANIGKDGSINNLRVKSGPKKLQASSIDAVKTWKYKPYLLNGDPIEVETTINVTYSLKG